MAGVREYKVYLILLAIILMVLPGCPKKAEMTMAPETQSEEGTAAAETADNSTAGDEAADAERAAAAGPGLQPVYFDFDSSVIRYDARETMKANAEWLQARPAVRVRVEGNCDERGTIEYNQALGQRRASSVKKYLTDLGISSGRISLISYGKEKPVCTENTDGCWQENRRGDIVGQE